MRLEQTAENVNFAQWLLSIGSGESMTADGSVKLPQHMCLTSFTPTSLIDSLYPNIASQHHPDQYFLERTILSCKNDDVDELNTQTLSRFPGGEKIYWSADKVIQDAENQDIQPYPAEFLATINASGLPLARLALKEGVPLMLLRNLDPEKGLCNGTRMVLTRMKPHVLECRLLSGDHVGETVFIPRISLSPSGEDLPIALTRRQFPVRLAFAMTINKSQGQSVKYVGLDLRTPVFSHGQLYVALSRCTSGSRIKVLLSDKETNIDTKTSNIVYPEILLK